MLVMLVICDLSALHLHVPQRGVSALAHDQKKGRHMKKDLSGRGSVTVTRTKTGKCMKVLSRFLGTLRQQGHELSRCSYPWKKPNKGRRGTCVQ